MCITLRKPWNFRTFAFHIARNLWQKEVIYLHWPLWSSIATWNSLKTWRHVHIIFALLFRTSGLGFIRERRRGCLVTPLGSTWLRPGPDSSWLELCFALWRMLKYVYHAENIRYVMFHLVHIRTCSLAGHFESASQLSTIDLHTLYLLIKE